MNQTENKTVEKSGTGFEINDAAFSAIMIIDTNEAQYKGYCAG